MGGIIVAITLFTVGGRWIIGSEVIPTVRFIVYALLMNAVIMGISYKPVKAIMKGFNA
jgi:hypothetical protein